ncbi:MAG: iron(III)-transport ATP-binding protein, partial [Hyphomicrobiales bacterium]|nr:iron(III)-transport ATP-binding protein [Hyphomicrobiales bacterium]
LMLLDEPFSALDTGLRASTRRAVADLLAARGITTILVTHDQGEALSFADQVAVMRDGRILQAGDPRDLYLRPATPFVAEFLGEALILPGACRDGMAQTRLGPIPVADGAAAGSATLLLRPEQIVLQPMREGDDRCSARVDAVEFGGVSSLVTVSLVGSFADGGAPIVLHRNGLVALHVGDMVGLSVAGVAHVFPSHD